MSATPAIDAIESIQSILNRRFPEVRVDGDIGKISTAAFTRLDDESDIRKIQQVFVGFWNDYQPSGVVDNRSLRLFRELDEMGDIESARDTPVHPLTGEHTVTMSSFADLADVRSFNRCKENGGSDQKCFKVGDNGIGAWGAKTAQLDTPMVALPREIWRQAGKTGGAPITVRYGGKTVHAILGDTMPALANITNGAGMDANPATCAELGVKTPCMVHGVTWEWA